MLRCEQSNLEFVVDMSDFEDLGLGDTATRRRFNEHQAACIAMCEPCPIRDLCLKMAMDSNVVGVWGGTTAVERQHIRATRGVKPVPLVLRLPQDFAYDVASA